MKWWQKVLIAVVMWRLVLLLAAIAAPSFLPYKPSFPYHELLGPDGPYKLPKIITGWAQFDGVHYITIVEKGYFGTGLIQAFFPLYPLSVRLVRWLVPNTILAGLLVSNAALATFSLVWFSLCRRIRSETFAWWSLAAVLCFPTSFFLGSLYSESLFLLVTTGSLLLLAHRKWLLASIAAAAAAATRVVGVGTILLIAGYGFFEKTVLKKPVLLSLMGGIAISGLLAYMFYLHLRFSDALYFLHVQEEFGSGRQESIVLYPVVLYRSTRIVLTTMHEGLKWWAYVQEWLFGWLSFVSLALLAWLAFAKKMFRQEIIWPSLAFSLAVLFIPTTTGTFSSMPRYALAAFPLFWFVGLVGEKYPRVGIALLFFSTLLLLFNTVLFIQGYWVA